VTPQVCTRAASAAAPRVEGETSVDVVFDTAGDTLPRDHHAALRDALAACLPWLADERAAGVHPLKTADDGDRLLLSHRTKLMLRVPERLADAVLALRGRELDIGGAPLRLGAARVKALAAHPTISAAFVATMASDDLGHQVAVAQLLEAAELPSRLICGRLRSLRAGPVVLTGASAALHDLAPDVSLRLQREGLGEHRMLGCGLFVPHKAISGLD
jgi:CRISPR-associated protein Cas6